MPTHGDSAIDAMSFGQSSFERDLPEQALQEVKQHFGLPDESAALWGMSMGGAFAIISASDPKGDIDSTLTPKRMVGMLYWGNTMKEQAR